MPSDTGANPLDKAPVGDAASVERRDDDPTAPGWAGVPVEAGEEEHASEQSDWTEAPFLSAQTTILPRINATGEARAHRGPPSARWSGGQVNGAAPAGRAAPGYPPVRGPWLPAERPPRANGLPPGSVRAAAPIGVGAPRGTAPRTGSDALSASKVLAGGMAAATSAIFGSYFGAFGTVGGAAVGSVATALVTRFYQRSIERTGSKVRATVTGGAPTRSAHRLDEVDTVRIDARPHGRVRGSIVWATVMVFLLGLGLVTGVEMAKGSSVLGNHQGTSVQRLFGPAPGVEAPPGSHRRSRYRSTGQPWAGGR